MENERPLLKVVPNTDLPMLFEAGWTFKASLGDGQSIVEAPPAALTQESGVRIERHREI